MAMIMSESYTYYIGDLAYVLTDTEWDTACGFVGYEEGCLDSEDDDILNPHSGRPFVWLPTAYGDGCYLDRYGNEYSVDSGTIGLIDTNYVTDTDKLQYAVEHGLGHLLTVGSPIDASECYSEDGVLCFGAQHAECVEIDTGD